VVVALIAAAVAVGAVVALGHTAGSSSSTSTHVAARQTTARRRPGTVLINPANVTVAVLNGTATAGLAHKTATRLSDAGFKEGRVATASDQTHRTTIVAFLPAGRNDALAVAKVLKVPTPAVQPIDSGTRAVACPSTVSCDADVVVTVGADLASAAG
jgi:hypothetical protein